MSPRVDTRITFSDRFILSILCAMWLWSFMGPMEQLHLVESAATFRWVFAALILAQWLPWKTLRLLAAIAASEWYMVYYFSPTPRSFHLRDLLTLAATEREQLIQLLTQHDLPDPLQTHLFLLCIAGVYWLVVYASTRTRLWVLYNALALVVLAVIDGNTAVHPGASLVTVVVVFVLVLGLAQFQRLRDRIERVGGRRGTARHFGPVAALLGTALTVGWAIPKAGPVWADPSKQIAGWYGSGSGAGGGGAGLRVIGYQEDNSLLGGPFVPNHDPALSVITKYPAYLRGEVYSAYTGKGWVVGSDQYEPLANGNAFWEHGLDQQRVPGAVVSQQITVLSGAVHARVLLGAYALGKVVDYPVSPEEQMDLALGADTVYAPGIHQGTTYTVQSYEPQDPSDLLRTLPPLPPDYSAAFPASIVAQDLQLPPLPSRVHDLAASVAAGKRNEYEIVTAIRDYLRTHYTYETNDVPVPGPNQDYVDQFLFESRRGYCNNFSSAMAVMLRSLGIPARWVTGFATGTIDPAYSGPGNRYIYENSDAHSWVEVYFPTIGWIPFDPTPDFYIPYVPGKNSGVTAGSSDSSSAPSIKKPPKLPNDQSAGSAAAGSASGWLPFVRKALRWLGVSAVVAGIVYLVLRRRIREWRHQWVWRTPTTDALTQAVRRLVQLLRKYGEIRAPAVTLRDLSRTASSHGIEEADYIQLVRTTESAWYGQCQPPIEELERARATWSRWILAILRRGR